MVQICFAQEFDKESVDLLHKFIVQQKMRDLRHSWLNMAQEFWQKVPERDLVKFSE